MTNNKSNSRLKIKYLLSLPIMLFMVLLMAINYNSFAQDDKIYDEVDVMATYKGGDISGVRKFIAENLVYPKSARDNKITAKIFVQFIIDENGKVDDVHIKRSDVSEKVGDEVVVVAYSPDDDPKTKSNSIEELEAEAIRVIKLLDGFTPAQKDGKNVKTQFTFPIKFALQ